jgi:hypothetical protein
MAQPLLLTLMNRRIAQAGSKVLKVLKHDLISDQAYEQVARDQVLAVCYKTYNLFLLLFSFLFYLAILNASLTTTTYQPDPHQ